ncbi:caspase family protein [Bradyrhizobium sp. SZCCHNR1070]|uniref:caspase family protein n=1 Tax=Bradyrhizobium sp. SZCCHNR1070 TaxID=3057361 RepID=UPI002916CE14|nr:caspase family protein [Bradyrhizobium sp. SZCCHNR1070]
MFRQLLCAALAVGGLLVGAKPAAAENRLALVIGQSAYRAVTALPNPANDAKAMAQLLTDAGFDVTAAADLSLRDINRQVGDFAARVAAKGPDTVALVFYAGHGLQIDGENYLIPVDVDPQREADIPLQAVRLNDVLNTLNSVPSRMRILLLDACRNNPFPALNQTAGHGLALVDAKTGAPGTFLSYSTSPGAEAEDGSGSNSNSPYTAALLKAAREPGLPIEEAFKRVRVAVNKETEGRQTPWESSSLTEDFRFIAATDASAANAAPKLVTAKLSVEEWRRTLQGRPVELAHEMIVGDGSVEAYEAFVTLYTQPPFGPQARAWLDLHNRMAAWNEAVLINTVASYQAFLGRYPESDLTPTARKLIERLRNRPVVTPVAAVASTSVGSTAPQGSPSIAPTNAAIGPCSMPPRNNGINKVEEKPSKKHEANPPRRASRTPHVRDFEDVVVYEPPVRQYYAPPVRVPPVGIGIGGVYGGGYGRIPPHFPSRRDY